MKPYIFTILILISQINGKAVFQNTWPSNLHNVNYLQIDLVQCPKWPFTQNGLILLPHPTNCQKFFQCFYNTPIELSCSSGLYFDSRFNICTYPEYSNCVQKSKPEFSTTTITSTKSTKTSTAIFISSTSTSTTTPPTITSTTKPPTTTSTTIATSTTTTSTTTTVTSTTTTSTSTSAAMTTTEIPIETTTASIETQTIITENDEFETEETIPTTSSSTEFPKETTTIFDELLSINTETDEFETEKPTITTFATEIPKETTTVLEETQTLVNDEKSDIEIEAERAISGLKNGTQYLVSNNGIEYVEDNFKADEIDTTVVSNIEETEPTTEVNERFSEDYENEIQSTTISDIFEEQSTISTTETFEGKTSGFSEIPETTTNHENVFETTEILNDHFQTTVSDYVDYEIVTEETKAESSTQKLADIEDFAHIDYEVNYEIDYPEDSSKVIIPEHIENGIQTTTETFEGNPENKVQPSMISDIFEEVEQSTISANIDFAERKNSDTSEISQSIDSQSTSSPEIFEETISQTTEIGLSEVHTIPSDYIDYEIETELIPSEDYFDLDLRSDVFSSENIKNSDNSTEAFSIDVRVPVKEAKFDIPIAKLLYQTLYQDLER